MPALSDALTVFDQQGAAPPPAADPSAPSIFPIVPLHQGPDGGWYNISDADWLRLKQGEHPPAAGTSPTPGAPTPAPGAGTAGAGTAPPTPDLDATMAQLRAGRPGAAIAPTPQASTPELTEKLRVMDHGSTQPIPPEVDPKFPVGPGQRTGYVANVGAGTTRAITGLAGLLPDVTTSVLNLAGKALGLSPIENPVGGSHFWNQTLGLIGANPENVAPADRGEQAAGTTAEGATSVMLPGGIAKRFLQVSTPVREAASVLELSGGRMPAQEANRALQTVAHGGGVMGGVAGGVGAETGDVASQLVDERYKPLVNLLGNLAGGGVVTGGRMGAELAARLAGSTVKRLRSPLNVGAKVTPIDPATGQPFVHNVTGEPISATADQLRIAGERQAAAMGLPPEAAVGAVPPPDAGTIGQPTLGQLMGDKNVLAYERSLRTRNRVAFTAAEETRNAERAKALAGIADPDVAREAAQDFVLARLRAIEAVSPEEAAHIASTRSATEGLPQTSASTTGAQMGELVAREQAPKVGASEAQLAQAREAAEAAESKVGGGPGTRLEDIGNQVQRPLQMIDQMRQDNVNRLGDLIDPNGRLVADNRPVIQRAKSILTSEERRPNRRALTGETKDILDAAAAQDAASPFRDLRDLRQRITDELRVQRGEPNGRLNVARLAQLLSAVDESFAAAAGKQAAEDAASVAGGSLDLSGTVGTRLAGDAVANPLPPAPTGAWPGTIHTPSGRAIGVRYKLVEADDLLASHDDDLNPNPKFPPQLQPRERGRAASELQVHNIAQKLRPESVGPSPSPMEGAPVVGPDNIVEAGNGRALGITRALQTEGPARDAYLDYLARQGFDTEGMKNPVLVRERTTPLTDAERVRFVQESNADPQLAMSAPEIAGQDAGRLSDNTLALWKGGDINSERNVPFVRAFIQNVVEKGQEGDLVSKTGELSVAGVTRIENALLAKAYGNSELVQALTETGDDNIRAFGGALRDAAPDMARLADDAAAGRTTADLAIGGHLAEAAKIITEARRRGVAIADIVNQHDMLGGGVSPLAKQALELAYGPELRGRMNRARMADGLRFYSQEARDQAGLFGQPETAEQLLSRTEQRYGRQAVRAEPGATGVAPGIAGNGAGSGAGGAKARRPGAGAQGEGTAGGAGDAVGEQSPEAVGPRVVPKPELTPNITPDDVARYAAMRAEHAEHLTLMHEGAVGDVLQPGATKGALVMQAERAAPRLFNAGGTPAADIKSFINAVGGATDAEAEQAFRKLSIDPETGEFSPDRLATLMGARRQAIDAIERYAGFSLRDAAMRNGALNPKLTEAWLNDHAAALDAFPGLREKFATAAARRERVADLEAERKALDADYPLARLGTNADVTARYIQPGPRGGERIQQYMRDTNGSPEALRVLDDGLLSSLRNAAFRNGEWSGPAFDNWVRQYAPALRERPDLARRLNTLGDAQNEVASLLTRRQDEIKALQNSAAGHYLTRTGEAVDSQAAIGSLMRSATSPADAAELVGMMSNDPVALAGLRRNVVDWMMNRVRGGTESGTSGQMQMRAATFLRDLGDPKMRRTLNAIFTPEQLDVFDRVATSLMQEGRSVSGTRIPGSPATAADIHAMGGVSHEPSNVLLQALVAERAAEIGTQALHGVGGMKGLMARAAAGIGTVIYQHMRAAGFKRIDDLAEQAVIQPELGRILMQRAIADPQSSLLDVFKQRLMALTAAGAAANQDKHRRTR